MYYGKDIQLMIKIGHANLFCYQISFNRIEIYQKYSLILIFKFFN